jgi:D-glycero-beta-D-manno-heptose 1-phosphate adenylyltransferase
MKIDKFEFIKSKIVDKNSLERLICYWRFNNKIIVFTNGCFDIIHRGHIDYLAKAANEGDVLIVGLNSDASVRKIKGLKRPIQDEYSRSLILASFSFITNIIIFDEETPYNLINFIKPDVLVKGSDYKPENIVGSDIVLANGGKIITINYIEGYSTTNIISKLK